MNLKETNIEAPTNVLTRLRTLAPVASELAPVKTPAAVLCVSVSPGH